MSGTPIRPDPRRAERNLRNAVRLFTPASVQVYGQDVVDILTELDRLRAAAVSALDHVDPASATSMRAAAGRLVGKL